MTAPTGSRATTQAISEAALTDPAAIAARLRVSATRLARQLRQESEPGLTPSQLSALTSVEHNGPLTLGRLAEHERVAPPSVTKIVTKLEEAGLVERRLDGGVRFAFRHFPLTEIHPHALAASGAAEAGAAQGRFWETHDLLFHRQSALEDDDLGRYAAELGLDVARFEADRLSEAVLNRIRRDVSSGEASGEVRGTPSLFIDGAVYRGGYDVDSLLEVLA